MLKEWTLRARLTAVLATVLCVFTILSTVAYLTKSRADDELELAFADELTLLAALPDHRAALRQIEIDSDNYLMTRSPEWLKRRSAAIAGFRERHLRLGARMSRAAQREAWEGLLADFDAYARGQQALLERARAGGLDSAQALREALESAPINALQERMSRFSRIGFHELELQRRASRSAALAVFMFVLGVGLLGSVALSAAIARIVVAPVMRLRDHAASWTVGKPWTLSPAPEMPKEVRELLEAMLRMTRAMNEQYEREHRTNLLKSQMVSGVSHEFNNALAVIHTAHVLLQETSPDSAEASPWHEMLESNISALSAMATNLLNLGRLESGEFKIDTHRVEVAPMLHGALERLKLLAKRRKIETKFECRGGLPPVSADADAVSLVVANLLSNAFKYTKEGGSVALGAQPAEGGGVEVYVRDNGIGIAPEDQKRIFEGWYRAEPGKREAKGFGVGLALSRMILEAHGAELALESELGKGSRFSFRLKPHDPRAVSTGTTIG